MTVPVLIFSTDSIRGKIVLKTLKHNGIEATLFGSNFELLEGLGAIKGHSVVIFDTKHYHSREFEMLDSLRVSHPRCSVLILSEGALLPMFIQKGFSADLCLSDPLDPEQICLKVREIFFIRSKAYLRFRTYLNVLYHMVLGEKDNPYIRFVKKLLLSFAMSLSVLLGLIGGFVVWSLSDLPKIQLLEEYAPLESSMLYSSDGESLAELYFERRRFIPYYKIPTHVRNAFIAVEDARFYSHHGLDFYRLIGAVIENVRAKSYVQGASTITQQLAKMLFLKPERTLTRKIKEAALSIQIENRYTKDEILGLYLNQAYFGTRAYGLEAASETYFGKKAEELTVGEAALLAAIPKAPSTYSPFKDTHKALSRKKLVLKMMLNQGFISAAKYDEAVVEPLPSYTPRANYKAPYFVEYARANLEKIYGDNLYTSGFKIYTTINYKMQEAAEHAVANGLSSGFDDKTQAALLAIDIKTGAIRAMVGGTGFGESQFNRATQAMRQPGSAFKPFIYLTAFKDGLTPQSAIVDAPVTYYSNNGRTAWTPQNYTRRYYGSVSLKSALSMSLNAATVNLASKLKMSRVIETARAVGIKSEIYPHLPAAIGVSEVTLMELVCAYGTMAEGVKLEPRFYERVVDRYDLSSDVSFSQGQRVISQQAVAHIREVLRSVVEHGTARAAMALSRPVYGKTGTTDDYADAWFIGFDDKLAVGVWVGRDDRTSLGEGKTGGAAALPIWIEFMKSVQ
ncbi:transglycosylase domain-containing protein [Candidatus Magnetobacterium casense]|uniref:PBP1A family penicillin-binding protein n=1 Tax=Candidatus Magnetobacterium casense TaxID=1455061 RepID=A0ABS6S1K2_9BACT|nr:PBP1A family penicillin-binding protein [Candidatus Magnetobacterium casensis]MBV6342696.1 PBP1A family penicillin-binding protein [Candidatus Magnetobacterium casensis]